MDQITNELHKIRYSTNIDKTTVYDEIYAEISNQHINHCIERICTTGWYGQNCSMECSGHCLDNDTCFHVNGTCLRGCAPGYREPTCSKGTLS